MPAITVNIKDLEDMLGKEIGEDELRESLSYLKCGVERIEEEEWEIETTSDRPDLLSAEGIARGLRGVFEIELGIPEYNVNEGEVQLIQEENTAKIRPYIFTITVRNVNFNEEAIRQIMQLQEKLHQTFCRRRKKASIGVYDLDKIKTPIYYKALPLHEIRFTPLEQDREMSGEEILAETPQGREYGKLIEKGIAPLLVDSCGQVLSMPPIVNSEETRVTRDTKNVFIDVTGLSEDIVKKASIFLATALAERGGEIFSVKHVKGNRMIYWPIMRAEILHTNIGYITEILGVDISTGEIQRSLLKARLEAETIEDKIKIRIPSYRVDIIHPIDIVEEVAIFYGYGRYPRQVPKSVRRGSALQRSKIIEICREIMVGAGYLEVTTLALGKREIYERWKEKGEICMLKNPISSEYDAMRNSLIPGLVDVIGDNLHYSFPLKIFEVGKIVEIIGDEPVEREKLAAAIGDDRGRFEEIHSLSYSIIWNMNNIEIELHSLKHGSFIEGRVASIHLHGMEIGLLGELSPSYLLEAHKVDIPVTVMEIDLEKLHKILKHE